MTKFFITEFDGVLITDFWAAYNAVCAADKQYCLVHLLRELEKVDMHNESAEWRAFAKKFRRLIGDGIHPNRHTAPTARSNRCRWVKCYR